MKGMSWLMLFSLKTGNTLLKRWIRLKFNFRFISFVHRVEEVSKSSREGRINTIRGILKYFSQL